MLAVTQFEVYVMQDGRSILHARYPADDRQEALWDARSTESETGFPAKVVRETYFPELNESERVTTYISPRVKKTAKGPSVEEAARAQQPLRGRKRPARHQPPMTAGHVALRVIVAAGFSLVGAALTAGIINWTLRSLGGLGISLTSSTESALLTYSYVAMFLLFFLSLFRSRLPLHRLLADLWHRAQPATLPAGQRPKDARPVRVRPKHDRSTSPETLREWQELRIRRGDPDIFETLAESSAGATAVAPPALPVLPQVAPPPELPSADLVKAEKPKPPAASVPPAPVPPAPIPVAPAAKTAPPAKPAQKPKPAEAPPVVEDETDFAHVELRRFADDVVKPAVLATMHDDPVTRRGMALVLAGAVDAVMQRPEARLAAPSSLLAWGLHQVGLTQAVIDLFVLQRPLHVALASNQPLVSEGKAAMEQMLAQGKSIRELVDAMAVTLAAWRTPYGQPGLLVHHAAETPAALVDIFLITEVRPRQLQSDTPERMADNEARLATHNERVRAALAATHGSELKHTGKGIFARFADAASALTCAESLQRELGRSIAMAVIGNSAPEEDPTLSSTLFLRAEAAVTQTADGQSTVDPHVTGEARGGGQPTGMVLPEKAAASAGNAAMVA